MFDLPILQVSLKSRTGIGQWTGEAVATFGLILTILGTARHRPGVLPASVALYITAAYWFTSSPASPTPPSPSPAASPTASPASPPPTSRYSSSRNWSEHSSV